jgi:hypothetical protein
LAIGPLGASQLRRYFSDLRFKLAEIANSVTPVQLLTDNIQVLFIQRIR